MNWGFKALLIEPASLREEIRSEAQAMVESYRSEPDDGMLYVSDTTKRSYRS